MRHERRIYNVSLIVNERQIHQVVIDPHYEKNHSASITDELILELVQLLNGGEFEIDQVSGEFEYFKTEPLYLREKKYRLVWLLKKNALFIGVVNAFRR